MLSLIYKCSAASATALADMLQAGALAKSSSAVQSGTGDSTNCSGLFSPPNTTACSLPSAINPCTVLNHSKFASLAASLATIFLELKSN